jgi:aminopeptidase N
VRVKYKIAFVFILPAPVSFPLADLIFMKKLLFLPLFLFSSFVVFGQPRVHDYDVQNYIIRSSFNRSQKTFSGDTTIQLKPLKANFNSLILDAADMTFESIKLDPAGTNLQYEQADEKLTVRLDRNYAPGDLISVRLKYSSKPKKGVYFVEAEENHPAQTWTQGEAEENHHWFPCYDYPDDKATTEQYITVPAGETAIANGEPLEATDNPDGTKTFHFKMPVVHSSYLTSFVAGKYAKVTDQYKNIPLGFYVFPGQEAIAPKVFGRTKDMIRVYEELTKVDFPYNKYDQTMVSEFKFGGMENITATTLADSEILFAAMGLGGEGIDLVSHELAHSWFGDLVTCKSWSELWLNEGFATYMEAAYREKTFGHADYLRKIREDANQFMASDAVNKKRRGLFYAEARGDDALFDGSNAPIIYQKGGAVLHTLHETVGDENFWKAINIYLNAHKFGSVESTDLKKAMEETSGKDLTWFFDQWVYKGGYPMLSIRQVYNPRTRKLNITVSQMQKADAVTPAAFILPLEIEIETAKGSKTEKLDISKKIQSFSLPVDGKPLKITVDNDEKIPLKTVKLIPLTGLRPKPPRK